MKSRVKHSNGYCSEETFSLKLVFQDEISVMHDSKYENSSA